MNKLVFVLLAICLVSVAVEAFVKRDAPAASNTNQLEQLQKDFTEFANKIGDQIKDNFNADKIKSDFETTVNKIRENIEELTKKKEPVNP